MTKWSFSEGRGLRTVITSKNWAVSLGKMEHRPLLWTCCFPLIKNVKYTQFKITITSPVTDDKGGSQWGDRTHWLTAQACFPEETRIQIHKTTHVCRNLGGGWWNRWKKPRGIFQYSESLVYDTVLVDTWHHACVKTWQYKEWIFRYVN